MRLDGGMGSYDALLVVSFGGPEGPDDVMPFLENVVRGRGVPRERLLEVAEHYQRLRRGQPDQPSSAASSSRPRCRHVGLPVYWGNRNWHPFLADTVRRMKDDGVRKAAAFVTSAYARYSSCRQYLEDIARARAKVPGAPEVDKLRHFGDHPGFIAAMADHIRQAIDRLPERRDRRPAGVHRAQHPALDGAHGGPVGGAYEAQLRRTRRLVGRRRRAATSGTWCGRAAAARRRCRGWSPTSATTWQALHARASARSCSCRSGSSPTTWRSSTTSTWRPRHVADRARHGARPGGHRGHPPGRFVRMVARAARRARAGQLPGLLLPGAAPARPSRPVGPAARAPASVG